MPLHPSVNTSYGSAFEATQASAVPSRAMTPPLPVLSRVLIRRPCRDALGVTLWFNRTNHLLPRSIAMIALHKPERATYDQAVEAQREFNRVVMVGEPPELSCTGSGDLICCC